MTGTFEARYGSRCLACERSISPGDAAKWVDGEVIHAECVAVDNLRPMRDPCPECWTVPAANGLCGCDA